MLFGVHMVGWKTVGSEACCPALTYDHVESIGECGVRDTRDYLCSHCGHISLADFG